MSGKIKNNRFGPDTNLSETGLEFVDVVLTERFLLPPAALRKMGEPVPETLAEIAAMSGLDLAQVVAVVEECLELSQDLYFEAEQLEIAAQLEGTVIVDMRPDISIETEPLHPSARLFHAQSPAHILPFLRSMNRVIVLSDPQSHAWSAALALRKMSIKAFLWGSVKSP